MIANDAGALGTLLREARRGKGMTQQALATALGVSRQWVIQAEAGAPTARLGLMVDALRLVDLVIDVRPDTTSHDMLDAMTRSIA
ncbi:MAG: helix-turn-helix domain-containing protein [Bifidobacteriaceae bacterium]|nr:helix-turn-helix domain-containing protein [Bifidobacteriaceae bacterium]